MSSNLRITGMATGMDTDTTIKQLMNPYKIRLDKMKQDKQIMQWKQEIYRDIIGSVNTFKSTYFDVLKTDSYMLSSKNFSTLQATTTNTTNAVTMTPGATALSGDYEIDVTNIAKKASVLGTKNVNIKQVSGEINFPVVINSNNDKLVIDGKDVTLDKKVYSNISELVSTINGKLVSTDDGTDISKLVKAVVNSDNNIEMKRLTVIDSNNKNVSVTVGGKTFEITLSESNYSLDELASAINSKLSVARAKEDGSSIPNGFIAQVSADDLKVEYAGGSDNRNFTITSKPIINSENIADPNKSNPTIFNGDTLSYDKRIIAGINDVLTLNINGTRTNITLSEGDYTSDANLVESIAADINSKLTTVPAPGGGVMFNDVNTFKLKAYKDIDGKLSFISTTDNQISMSGNATTTLGMSSTFRVNQTLNDKISGIVAGEVKFTINGEVFHYDFSQEEDNSTDPNDLIIGGKNKTIRDVLSEISVRANVDISYSELNRKFTINSKDTGEDQVINASDNSGSFLGTLLGTGTITDVKGEDAEIKITNPKGESNTLHYANNTFSIDDVSYVVNKEGQGPIIFSVTADPEKAITKVKDFIEKYNEMVGKIRDKVNESRPKSGEYSGYYLPLTDEQKSEMSEDSIKLWETKAKEGLVKNDSYLNNMLTNLRKVFYDSVENAGITLSEIGIGSSSDISQAGKIVINDEQKLKDTLLNNPDKVRDLFIKTSNTSYTADHTNYSTRYKESGILQRINDVLQDNVRTIRDSSGKKGVLLEKAGIVGDFSEYNNILYNQMKDQDKRILDFSDRLTDRENRYYIQFSKLESAMNSLNSQSSWLAQQLGTASN